MEVTECTRLNQVLYYLRSGRTINLFENRRLNIVREEKGEVVVYVFPLYVLPVIGNKVFYRIQSNYTWVKQKFKTSDRICMLNGLELIDNPKPKGVFALLSRLWQ